MSVPICAIAVAGFALAIMGCGGSAGSQVDGGNDSGTEGAAPTDSSGDATQREAASDALSERSSGDEVADADEDVVDGAQADGASGDGGDASVDSSDDTEPDEGTDATLDSSVDASIDSPMDSTTRSDATLVCSVPTGFGYAGGGPDGGSSCGTGEDYTCSGHSYEIACECPTRRCTCSKDGRTVGVTGYSGCPSCSYPDFATVAAACHVPL
jgi:hypothetical protein